MSADVARFIVRAHRDRVYNVAVTGPLDGRALSSLGRLLHELACDHVTLDLTECTRMTDEAFDEIVEASRIATGSGGEVRIYPARRAQAQ